MKPYLNVPLIMITHVSLNSQYKRFKRYLFTTHVKDLTKLSTQIHEVKVHQWKLKEVDETIRDPRTIEDKLLGELSSANIFTIIRK